MRLATIRADMATRGSPPPGMRRSADEIQPAEWRDVRWPAETAVYPMQRASVDRAARGARPVLQIGRRDDLAEYETFADGQPTRREHRDDPVFVAGRKAGNRPVHLSLAAVPSLPGGVDEYEPRLMTGWMHGRIVRRRHVDHRIRDRAARAPEHRVELSVIAALGEQHVVVGQTRRPAAYAEQHDEAAGRVGDGHPPRPRRQQAAVQRRGVDIGDDHVVALRGPVGKQD